MIVERLRSMQEDMPDIVASAVVSGDGLVLASILPPEIEEDRVAAMSAALLSLGEQISQELRRGSLEQVFVRGTDGFIVISSIGTKAVLTVLARQEAKPGLVFLEMRRASEQLLRILG